MDFTGFIKNPRTGFYFGITVVNIAVTGYIFGFLNPGDIDTDGGIFSAIALKNMNGGRLYIDAWENKPPGIFYMMECFFAIIPNKVYALYCFSSLGILALANGIWLTSYALLRSVILSLLVMASFILIAINNYFMSDGLYTEIFGSAFIIWSLYFYHKYSTINNIKYAVMASLLAGAAIWLKEPFIFLSGPIALMLIIKNLKKNAILKILGAMLLPTAIIIILLLLSGSLNDFFEMEIANFRLSGARDKVISSGHLDVLWDGVLRPLPVVWILIVFFFIKLLIKPGHRKEALLNGLLLAGGLGFIFVSPYSFGHYYLPLLVILFYCMISLVYYDGIEVKKGYRIIFGILLLFSAWRLDQEYVRGFKTHFKAYKPDAIVQTLRKDSNATLFIDNASVSEYYIKSGKTFPFFLAVPISVHFSNDIQGAKRLQRMYDEFRGAMPDYLITNESFSEMAQRFPEPGLYTNNYERIDSVLKREQKIILWRRMRIAFK